MPKVVLQLGEKDGQTFTAPWPSGKHPTLYYVMPASGDEELAALGLEAPEGLRTELSTLAYSYLREVHKDREGLLGPEMELQYIRTPELDIKRRAPKPAPKPRSKKQGQ